MRLRLGASAVVLLALVAAGCAIPTQSSPSTMSPSRVPFHLLSPHPPTTTTTQPKPSSYVQVKVFFLNSSQQLTPVQRFVAAPVELVDVVAAVLRGPSSTDPQGTTTAIPSNVGVISVAAPQNNIVTVNMNTAFGEITGGDTELAVAQIVATVTAEAGLSTGVIFEIDGERTSVPIANGQEVADPVYLIEFLAGAT